MSPETGLEAPTDSQSSGNSILMPLFPAGTLLWSGVSAAEIDFDSISHPGAILLAATSMLANGAAVIAHGEIIDCVLVDQSGLHFGPQLAKQLLALANAGYSATEVDESVASYLPMLWRNTPISTALDKRWIEVYGLMESVGEAGDERVVTIESGTSRGVVIFAAGRAVAAYTSIDRRPSVAYQVVLPLFHDGKMGTVNIFEGANNVPEAPVAVSEVARSLVTAAVATVGGGWEALAPPPINDPIPLFSSPANSEQLSPSPSSPQPAFATPAGPAEAFPSPASFAQAFPSPAPVFHNPGGPEPINEATAGEEGSDWLANIADEKESWPELFDRSAVGTPEATPAGGGLLAKKMAQELSQQSPGNQVRFGFMVSQLLALTRQELGSASPVVEQVINSSEPTLEGLTTAIATVNALVPPGITREQMANLVATMRMIVNDRFAQG